MNTNLNDVVTEIYYAFLDKQKIENERFNSELNALNSELNAKLRDMSIKARLRRLLRDPAGALYRCIKKIFPNDVNNINSPVDECEKICLENSKTSVERNVFTPTNKKFPNVKIAVYTIITGGYDDLREPFYVDDQLDYYVITDSHDTQFDLHRGGGMESNPNTYAA